MKHAHVTHCTPDVKKPLFSYAELICIKQNKILIELMEQLEV